VGRKKTNGEGEALTCMETANRRGRRKRVQRRRGFLERNHGERRNGRAVRDEEGEVREKSGNDTKSSVSGKVHNVSASCGRETRASGDFVGKGKNISLVSREKKGRESFCEGKHCCDMK